MFGFLKFRPEREGPAQAAAPSGHPIDPDGIFSESAWPGPEAEGGAAVWRIETPAGAFYADAHAVEIVDGALILLDQDDIVLGVLDAGQWDRVGGAGPGALPASVAARDAA